MSCKYTFEIVIDIDIKERTLPILAERPRSMLDIANLKKYIKQNKHVV